jgi:ABC-type multidrug transport system ATPase subunit
MSLLELEHVSKRRGRGRSEHVILRDVSFEIDLGELVAIWGLRHSGRSTLLRIASGVERTDTGTVRFGGNDLSARDGDVSRGAIGYCQMTLRPAEGQFVLEQLMMDQLTRGIAPKAAGVRARRALARTGAEHCAGSRPTELDGADAVRVAVARALARQPKLLVIDEPILGVDLLARDTILLLLRSLADDGIAVLTSTTETTGLAGADRALSLGGGELRGSSSPELASVVPLRRPA